MTIYFDRISWRVLAIASAWLALCFVTAGCVRLETAEGMRRVNMTGDLKAMRAQELNVSVPTEEGDTEVAGTFSLSQPFSLDDAITFALVNNLDAAVAQAEREVQAEATTGAMFDLLPSLILSAERSRKSRRTPSSSENYYTGQESLAPSVSSDLESHKESVEFSWEIMNFCIGVLKWRQERWRLDVSKQRIRRVRQNLVHDVTRAYAKVTAAQETAEQAEFMIRNLENRRVQLRDNMKRHLVPPSEALRTEAAIMETTFALRKIIKEYDGAMIELVHLMGLPVGTEIALSGFDFSVLPGTMDLDLDAMYQEAMLNRPELLERDVGEEILVNEANQALFRMMPSIKPYYRYDHDANSYLLFNDWYSYGLRISWDLFSIPRHASDKRKAEAETRRIRKERVALGGAILAQLNLAVVEYKDMAEQAAQLKSLAEMRAELAAMVRMEVEQGKVQRSQLLDAEERSLAAKMEYHAAYARLVSAMARVTNSLGHDRDTPLHAAPGDTAKSLELGARISETSP